MNTTEVQTILSIQELDDALFEHFRNLPMSTTTIIEFVEDAFEDFRRTLFTIQEIDDGNEFYENETTDDEPKRPFVHFIDDPEYMTVGEVPDSENTPTYSWDWNANAMVQKKRAM